jgi:hypothetical protein
VNGSILSLTVVPWHDDKDDNGVKLNNLPGSLQVQTFEEELFKRKLNRDRHWDRAKMSEK